MSGVPPQFKYMSPDIVEETIKTLKFRLMVAASPIVLISTGAAASGGILFAENSKPALIFLLLSMATSVVLIDLFLALKRALVEFGLSGDASVFSQYSIDPTSKWPRLVGTLNSFFLVFGYVFLALDFLLFEVAT